MEVPFGYIFMVRPWFFVGCCALVGLIVGSFLNVVIYRLPVMLQRQWKAQCAELGGQAAAEAPEAPAFNLVKPRSACPSCKTQIKAWHNVPVVSWLLLRGRCASCNARISARYPLVEALTALLSAVAWQLGFGWAALAALVLTWFLIALTFIDIDHQLLPDSMTLPLVWLGLLFALWGPEMGASLIPVHLRSSIIGAIAGYVSLWSVYHLFKLATGKEGMGYGDFKLLAALGAWLGWQMLLPIILMASAVGAVVGIAVLSLQRQSRSTPIAFGPFLATAGWIMLVFGQPVMGVFNGLFGFRPVSVRGLRVGLTGGIASGKSTVANLFAALGIPVVDADVIAREVVAPGQPLLAAIAERLGKGVLAADGGLNRAALRELIFRDPKARDELESLTHPAILTELERQADAAKGPYVLLAIPLLVEKNLKRMVNRVLVVDCEESLQIQRLQARDGATREAAQAILAAQASRAERLSAADDVILNSGDLHALRDQVESLHERYLALC